VRCPYGAVCSVLQGPKGSSGGGGSWEAEEHGALNEMGMVKGRDSELIGAL
jgi:hypothetical protein